MKLRFGFVSNSSSSSFMIRITDVTPEQIEKIKNHEEQAGYDAWGITVNDIWIMGDTSMGNFDMEGFLATIGVDTKLVAWENGHW